MQSKELALREIEDEMRAHREERLDVNQVQSQPPLSTFSRLRKIEEFAMRRERTRERKSKAAKNHSQGL